MNTMISPVARLEKFQTEGTILVYHATNVDINEIGKSKKTMFFTADYEIAIEWGRDHYDEFHVIYAELPLDKITEYNGEVGREDIKDYDFERKEFTGFEEDILWNEGLDRGYIVSDVTNYELNYV